jgi:nicotinate-nucleotide--dimethylbenzimidazole phosphoribosyltransferase
MLSTEDVWRHLDGLTKPPRSLGRLEELACRLCVIQQTLAPQTRPRRLVLFAGDHGVAASGVSAWPSAVTGLMVQTIAAGKAASTVLARESQTETVLVNVGTLDSAGDVVPAEGIRYRDARVRRGTRNLADEPALTRAEFELALEIGRAEARSADEAGNRVALAGEMGIGNTTPAACLAMLLADVPLAEAVGRGAGADDAALARKRKVVELAVRRSQEQFSTDSTSAMAGVSGLEIAAMAGFFLEAHARRLTILLDGYVATAAALIAEHLQPGTAGSMLAAHLSAEPGHRRCLDTLGLQPWLEWQMRLGEGTGALVLLPLVDAAAAIASQMATLASLNVKGTS